MVVETLKTVAGVEVDVAVASVEFKPGRQPTGRAVIFISLRSGLRAWEWSCFRNLGKSENAARGVHCGCRSRCGSVHAGSGSGCGLVCTIVLLLPKKWKRQERCHRCCCTPLTHKHPP